MFQQEDKNFKLFVYFLSLSIGIKNILTIVLFVDTIGNSLRSLLSITISHVVYTDDCLMKKIPIFLLYSDSTGYHCLGFFPSSFLVFYELTSVRCKRFQPFSYIEIQLGIQFAGFSRSSFLTLYTLVSVSTANRMQFLFL